MYVNDIIYITVLRSRRPLSAPKSKRAGRRTDRGGVSSVKYTLYGNGKRTTKIGETRRERCIYIINTFMCIMYQSCNRARARKCRELQARLKWNIMAICRKCRAHYICIWCRSERWGCIALGRGGIPPHGAISRPYTGKWWMWIMFGILIRIWISRNFCDIVEISAPQICPCLQ